MTVTGTCRLCHAANVALRDSHILPGWAYQRIRQQSARDPHSKNHNPVLVKKDKAVQISTEIKQHMLCDLCEQKLGVRENWFKQITEATAALPPLSGLLAPNRVRLSEYALAGVGRLDVDAFVFFALSVFWRAHECSKTADFRLAPEVAEALRRYLHAGDALPASLALTVYFYEQAFIERPNLMSAFKTPVTTDGLHVFVLSCLTFALWQTAEAVDDRLCLLHSPDKALIVAPTEELAGPLRERTAAAQPKGTLRAYTDARAGRRRPVG